MPSTFQPEHLNVRVHLQDLCVNEKIILKRSFHKYSERLRLDSTVKDG